MKINYFKTLAVQPTNHFVKQVAAKNFDPEAVLSTLSDPTELYPSRSHPGQYRVTGNGLCIVGEPRGSKFVLLTIYKDRVVTPVRPDQLNTPEGRNFAINGRNKR